MFHLHAEVMLQAQEEEVARAAGEIEEVGMVVASMKEVQEETTTETEIRDLLLRIAAGVRYHNRALF